MESQWHNRKANRPFFGKTVSSPTTPTSYSVLKKASRPQSTLKATGVSAGIRATLQGQKEASMHLGNKEFPDLSMGVLCVGNLKEGHISRNNILVFF